MSKVRLVDVAYECKESCKTDKSAYPIVGLEHLVPEQIVLDAWDEDVENTFTKIFREGAVLFGRRRAYLKKAVVAPFDGICSGDITVIDAIEGKINRKLLPFIIQNDVLFDFAVGKSAGSLSPRVKWEHLKNFEFTLPEAEEQEKLSEVLWAMEDAKSAYKKLLAQTDELVKSQFIEMFSGEGKYEMKSLAEVSEVIAGGDKPKDNSEEPSEEYCYPVYANGIEAEGLQCFSKEYRVEKSAVTISARGTIGATFIRKPFFTPVVRLIAVIPNEEVNVTYLKYAIDAMGVSSTGSSQQQLTIPNVKKEMIAVPPLAMQLKFEQLVRQSDKSKFELQQSLDRLCSLQKTLLTEAFFSE